MVGFVAVLEAEGMAKLVRDREEAVASEVLRRDIAVAAEKRVARRAAVFGPSLDVVQR